MRGLGKKEKIEENGKIEENEEFEPNGDDFKYHSVEVLGSRTEAKFCPNQFSSLMQYKKARRQNQKKDVDNGDKPEESGKEVSTESYDLNYEIDRSAALIITILDYFDGR